ncbi:unnamed protein product [Orchesella dallaii]|uniref:RING-type E3 ubiquitin transferase BRCA1 n=1 Tax=Orchesella dallaii TaxID=48710 RepID=A0ABP1QKT1_9HEXA
MVDATPPPRTPLPKTFEDLTELFDCAICRSPMKNPTQISCGHVYCSFCLKQVTRSITAANCPLCKKKINRRSMVVRNDIEEMSVLVKRMSEAFHREMNAYIQETMNSMKDPSSPPERVVPSVSPSPDDLNNSSTKDQVVEETKIPESLAKSMKMKELLQQPYIIMTSSVVPETSPLANRHVSETALDLSTPCTSRSLVPVNYVYKEAIRYVKPMDLSVKKKRKLEVASDSDLTSIKSNDTVSPCKSTNPAPLKKNKLMKTSQHQGTERPENLSVMNTVSTPSTRSCRSYGKSEVNEINESAVKTNSDEILGNLSEDVLISKEQTRKTRSSTKKDTTKTQADTKNESFVFKQPSLTTQGTPSPKSKNSKKSNSPASASQIKNSNLTIRKVKPQEIMADFDDEIRDSDLLFLRIDDKEIQNGTSPVVPSPKDHNKEKSMITECTSTENTSQDMFKSRSGTPVQSSNRLSRKKHNTEAGKSVDKTPERHCTNDLFGDVAWVNDDFSSNESQPNPQNSGDKAVTHKGRGNRKTSTQKRYVFCPTRLTKDQLGKLQQLCKLCNGTISNDFTSEVTHLIINLSNGRVPQTLKYLLAIAGRKWVVIYDWVEKCVGSGSVVPEEAYETSNFKQCDLGVKRSRLANRDLFKNFKFYFATDTFRNMGYSFVDVKKLMSALGAEVLPSIDDVDSTAAADLIIIGDRTANVADYYNWFLTHEWITVSFQWVLDCILKYEVLKLSSNYLCIDIDDEDIDIASCALKSQSCSK